MTNSGYCGCQNEWMTEILAAGNINNARKGLLMICDFTKINDKMVLRCGLLFVLSFLSSFELVECGGQLSLRFIRFDNPGSRAHSGRCCDNIKICLNDCDVFMKMCMSLRSQAASCSLLNIETPKLGGDSFDFRSSLGNGYSNPFVYSFNQWSEPFRIKITVLDEDSKNILGVGRTADLISDNSFEVTQTPDVSVGSAAVHSLSLRGYRSVLKLKYQIYCDAGYFKPLCSDHCIATDDNTGHYTCDYLNSKRICLANWYGPRCTTFCQAKNDSGGHYTCNSDGSKSCIAEWYGDECKQHCASRDDATGHFSCSSEGKKVCLANWYGKHCTKYCEPRDHDGGHFSCNETGDMFCLADWYGQNCTTYCNENSLIIGQFKCLSNGTKVCGLDWFGTNCSRFCQSTNGPVASYACSDSGTKICNVDWYGDNCDAYCQANVTSDYKCNENGTKLCHEDWHGFNCDVYCKNDSSANYYCNATGSKVCNAGWYGMECSKYTGCIEEVLNQSKYYCDGVTGKMMCKDGWTGDGCQHKIGQNFTDIVQPSVSDSKNWQQPTTSVLAEIPELKKPDSSSQTNQEISSFYKISNVQENIVSTQQALRKVKYTYLSSISATAMTRVESSIQLSKNVENSFQTRSSPAFRGTSSLSQMKSARRNPARHSMISSTGNFNNSPIPKQNSSQLHNSNKTSSSKFKIMAYICGPLLLCMVFLLGVTGLKKVTNERTKRTSKVMKINLNSTFSSPEMVHLLKSTRISNAPVDSFPLNSQPRSHDSLLNDQDYYMR